MMARIRQTAGSLKCNVCHDETSAENEPIAIYGIVVCNDCLVTVITRVIDGKDKHPALMNNQSFDLEQCANFLDADLIDRYKHAALEQTTNPCERVYCACGKFVGTTIKPRPHGTFCAVGQCKTCDTFHCMICTTPVDIKDSMVKALQHDCDAKIAAAKKAREEAFKDLERGKDYQFCPTCGRAIELSEACNHMSCPCGEEFCYACGEVANKESGHWAGGFPAPPGMCVQYPQIPRADDALRLDGNEGRGPGGGGFGGYGYYAALGVHWQRHRRQQEGGFRARHDEHEVQQRGQYEGPRYGNHPRDHRPLGYRRRYDEYEEQQQGRYEGDFVPRFERHARDHRDAEHFRGNYGYRVEDRAENEGAAQPELDVEEDQENQQPQGDNESVSDEREDAANHQQRFHANHDDGRVFDWEEASLNNRHFVFGQNQQYDFSNPPAPFRGYYPLHNPPQGVRNGPQPGPHHGYGQGPHVAAVFPPLGPFGPPIRPPNSPVNLPGLPLWDPIPFFGPDVPQERPHLDDHGATQFAGELDQQADGDQLEDDDDHADVYIVHDVPQ